MAENDYVVVAPKAPKEIEQDSSQFNRIDKSFQVVGILTGYGPNPTTSATGLQAGYFLNREMLLLVEATSGKRGNFFSSSIYEDDTKGQTFGVHFKHHTGNSFYYKTGLDYRKIDYRYSYQSSINGDESISFNGDSVAATFQIGNQWQWDNFTMGCDWVGISVPLTHNTNNEYISPGAQASDSTGLSNYYRKKLDDNISSVSKDSAATLLRFYLGFSW